jgi:septum formation protein
MLYLASASPRRQELLRQAGIEFKPMPSCVAEVRQPNESAHEYVVRAATDKARAVAARVTAERLIQAPVLGADTEVVWAGEVLGKPQNETHGKALLKTLSGNTHTVLSALALVHEDKIFTALNESQVTFYPLTDAEIDAYWKTGEPVDKAGGYAVQGRASVFITRIEGSFSGIVGLPLFELSQLLKQAGVR